MPSRGWRSGRVEPRGLNELELDRRLSCVETALAWLLAAAWRCAAILVGLVEQALLASVPMTVPRDELIRLMQE